MPARATSVLSDGSVTPASGTTATAFTFSVRYASSAPRQPAQAVWADVGGVTVPLVKVSGNAHDGTWQGSSTLPAGSWQVTFHVSTSSEPQPEPLLGPIVTVTQAPSPTPTPSPTPRPTAAPTPTPRPPTPTPRPSPPPTGPTSSQAPGPQSTAAPEEGDDSTDSPSPSSSPVGTGSAGPTATDAGPSGTAGESGRPGEKDQPGETPGPSDPVNDDAATPPGSRLASLLIVGGTMSLAGAAVLARQWYVSRRPHP